MSVKVKAGDLGGYRAGDAVGAAIRFIERDLLRREGRSRVNHYWVCVRGGYLIGQTPKAQIVEALLFDGVVKHRWCDGYSKADLDRTVIQRPKNLGPTQIARIVARANSYKGMKYGVGKIFLHLLHLQRWARKDHMPICTWVAAMAYQAAGLDFGKPAQYIGPDDIDDFARNNPDKYEIVKDLAPRFLAKNGG